MADTAVQGWAVFSAAGVPLIRTVMGERRGAIVNWLVTDAGFRIGAQVPDDLIERCWASASLDHAVTVEQVLIVPAPGGLNA